MCYLKSILFVVLAVLLAAIGVLQGVEQQGVIFQYKTDVFLNSSVTWFIHISWFIHHNDKQINTG